jgi:hypothetical protein
MSKTFTDADAPQGFAETMARRDAEARAHAADVATNTAAGSWEASNRAACAAQRAAQAASGTDAASLAAMGTPDLGTALDALPRPK